MRGISSRFLLLIIRVEGIRIKGSGIVSRRRECLEGSGSRSRMWRVVSLRG